MTPDMFNVLMVNELMARAQRQSTRRRSANTRVSRDAARCAAAVAVLLETGDDEGDGSLWEAIDAVVPRAELRAAVANIEVLTPPLEADAGGEWRAVLVERYAVVRRFLPQLCKTIDFAATAEAEPVLAALSRLPDLLETRATRRVPAGYLDAGLVAAEIVPQGWWRRLVFAPGRPEGTVDRAGYVFCVLEQFHQRLRRRDISRSPRHGGPTRGRLLSGPAWQTARALLGHSVSEADLNGYTTNLAEAPGVIARSPGIRRRRWSVLDGGGGGPRSAPTNG